MPPITPVVFSAIQATQAQQEIIVEKQRQVRRAQNQEKDIAVQDDVLEHQVESSDETPPSNDEDEQRKKRSPKRDSAEANDGEDDKPHIDLIG